MFLPSEVDLIYRISPAARRRADRDKHLREKFCFVCFKDHLENATWEHCKTCGVPMDKDCYKSLKKARSLTARATLKCIVCLDESQWDVEQYRERYEQASAAEIPSTEVRGPSMMQGNANSSIDVAEVRDPARPGRPGSALLSDSDNSDSDYADSHAGLNNNGHGDEPSDSDNGAGKEAVSPRRLRLRPRATQNTPLTVPERISKRQQEQQHQRPKRQRQGRPPRGDIDDVRTSMRPGCTQEPAAEEETNVPQTSSAVVSPGPGPRYGRGEPSSEAATLARMSALAPALFSASIFAPVHVHTTPAAPDAPRAPAEMAPSHAAPDTARQAVQDQGQAVGTSVRENISGGFSARSAARASLSEGAAHDAPEVKLEDVDDSHGGLSSRVINAAVGEVIDLTMDRPANPSGTPGMDADGGSGTGTLVSESALVDAATVMANASSNSTDNADKDKHDRKAAKKARKRKRLAEEAERLLQGERDTPEVERDEKIIREAAEEAARKAAKKAAKKMRKLLEKTRGEAVGQGVE